MLTKRIVPEYPFTGRAEAVSFSRHEWKLGYLTDNPISKIQEKQKIQAEFCEKAIDKEKEN